jgi:polyhydroxybutyrate depolymerase
MSMTRLFLALTLIACGAAGPGSGNATPDAGSDAGVVADGGGSGGMVPGLSDEQRRLLTERPYRTVIPKSYDGSKAYPLLVLLHGFTGNGAGNDAFFNMSPAIEKRGVLLATPDGIKNRLGISFWNATDACCNGDGTGKDDVAYLTAVVDDMVGRYKVDPKRIFFAGHSNGGFMSYRMACDRAEKIAAIVSYAGANWKDVSKCKAANSVSVLQVHSKADEVIAYAGGTVAAGFPVPEYPSATESLAFWATKNGCQAALSAVSGKANYIEALAGDETSKQASAGCSTGLAADLWTIEGAQHTPKLNTDFGEAVLDFLLAHPKP